MSRCPVCLTPVHHLTDPQGRARTLDTGTSRTGIWHPVGDGHSCRKLTRDELYHGGEGHHLHQCPASAEQATLFEGTA
jgi:hypothetical protein